MAFYAIGDVQGCFDELMRLLERLSFSDHDDYLWFTGDLVNRGPKSLDTLRFIKSLGTHAVTVLGNHDLHLLAVAQGHERYHHKKDTLREILRAPDRAELVDWLRHRPLMHYDATLGFALIHAGLPPQWDVRQALDAAAEVERALRADDYAAYLGEMYGNEPDQWSENLRGGERLRFIINCFTRLRFCDARGRLALEEKGAPGSVPAPWLPWFAMQGRRSADVKIVFGHWSTLGLYSGDNVYALDSGCLWGGALSALRLDGPLRTRYSVTCPAYAGMGG